MSSLIDLFVTFPIPTTSTNFRYNPFCRVYTEVLLKHLARPIDISKLFRIVTTEVQKKQVGEVNPMQPWYNANLLGGEEDIVLVEVTSAGGASSLPLFSALRLGVGASQQRKSGGAASKFVNPYDEE